jgi:hypothetical protein
LERKRDLFGNKISHFWVYDYEALKVLTVWKYRIIGTKAPKMMPSSSCVGQCGAHPLPRLLHLPSSKSLLVVEINAPQVFQIDSKIQRNIFLYCAPTPVKSKPPLQSSSLEPRNSDTKNRFASRSCLGRHRFYTAIVKPRGTAGCLYMTTAIQCNS